MHAICLKHLLAEHSIYVIHQMSLLGLETGVEGIANSIKKNTPKRRLMVIQRGLTREIQHGLTRGIQHGLTLKKLAQVTASE